MRINTRLLVASLLATLLLTDTLVSARKAGGQSATFKIVGFGPFVVSAGSLYLLDAANAPEGWKLLPDASHSVPPISPSEFAYYDGTTVVTDTGEGWVRIFGVGWTDVGPVPTTATRQTTWGQLKDKYRR